MRESGKQPGTRHWTCSTRALASNAHEGHWVQGLGFRVQVLGFRVTQTLVFEAFILCSRLCMFVSPNPSALADNAAGEMCATARRADPSVSLSILPPFLLLLLLLLLPLLSLSLSLSLSLCAVCRGSLYIGTGADKDRRTQTKMTQTKQHGDDTDKETRG